MEKGTTVLASFIFCLILCFVVWYLQNRSVLKQKHLFSIIFLTGLFCRIAFVFATPEFYAPDEEAHFKYVQYLSENKKLPVQTSCVGDNSNDWEYYQPPLYYSILAPVYTLGKLFFKKDESLIWLLRLLNVFFWIFLVLLITGLIKQYKIEDEQLQIILLCVACLLPTYTFLSAMVNNENLIIIFAYAIWYLFPAKKMSVKNGILLGITLGLAMLTKLSIVIYFPVFVALIIARKWYFKTNWTTTLNGLLSLCGIPFLLWMPIAVRNIQVYGNATALDVGNRPAEWSSLVSATLSTFGYIGRTFWAASGISNNIYSYFPFAGFFISVIAGVGLLLKTLRMKKNLKSIEIEKIERVLVFLGTIIVNLVLIFRFNFLYAMGQGRHLFICLFPISVFLGVGLSYFKIKNLKIYVSSFFITFAIVFTIYSLFSFPKMYN